MRMRSVAALSETIVVEDAKMISRLDGWSHDGQGHISLGSRRWQESMAYITHGAQEIRVLMR